MKPITLFLCLATAALLLGACATTRESTGRSPEIWNRVSNGMTRAEIVDQIGLPNRTVEHVDYWHKDGWELQATYDAAGKTTNLLRTLTLK